MESANLTPAEIEEKVSKCKGAVKSIINARSVCKRKITLILKVLNKGVEDSTLTKEHFLRKLADIDSLVIEIKNVDSKIVIYSEYDMFMLDPGLIDREAESQANYSTSLQSSLTDIDFHFSESKSSADCTNNTQIVNHVYEPRPPPLM